MPAKLTPMEKLEAKFRAGLVFGFTSFIVTMSLGFYLLPPVTYGKMRGVLRTEDGFTIIGMVVFAILCAGSLIALFTAVRALLGFPALTYDGEVIKEYVIPFRTIPRSEINHIEVGADEVVLHNASGKARTVNVRLVEDHRRFFDNLTFD